MTSLLTDTTGAMEGAGTQETPADGPGQSEPGVALPGAAVTATGTSLRLDARITDALRVQLREVAGHVVATIMEDIPAYREAFSGRMGENIGDAVQMALGGFLRLASRERSVDPSAPMGPALEAAFTLGRGEARNGRSADALLSAYRVGARVAWRELSATAVARGVPAETIAAFAEMVFAYIDELSASSVAGHATELAAADRERERHRSRLAVALAQGASPEQLATLAERARWSPPKSLTAVLAPDAAVRTVLASADPRTLVAGDEVAGLPANTALLFLPDAHDRARPALMRMLSGSREAGPGIVVGPARSWDAVHTSYRRALRAHAIANDTGSAPGSTEGGGRAGTLRARTSGPLDTEQQLVELVLRADDSALADLRERVLAPLAQLRPAAREKLAATLRSWLLHHGRREEVAADLFVHPQTVRYRVGQLRELYGDRLEDPRTVLELTVALA